MTFDWLTRALGSYAWIAAAFVALACLPMNGWCGQRTLIIDLLMGEPVKRDAMLEDLATARIVYLGEIHTIARHHRIQKDILEGLLERGLKLALGMEMFGAADQPVLDKWQKGNESFAGLVRDLGGVVWDNIADYQGLIETARENRIPIVGLNADGELVRRVARKGLEGLTDAERKALPTGVDRINPQHEKLLRLRLRVHKAFKGRSLAPIILAQAVRDATMADAVVRFLESPDGQDRHMIVVAGSGHVNYGFGVPDRVRRQRNWRSRIVLPTESGELVLSEREKRQAVPVTITHQDLEFITAPIADYLHVIEPKTEAPAVGHVAENPHNGSQ